MLVSEAPPYESAVVTVIFSLKSLLHIYILALVVLNLRTSELGGIAKPVNEIYYTAQWLAGRVIENPLVSVTIDVLMKCSSSFRANGCD